MVFIVESSLHEPLRVVHEKPWSVLEEAKSYIGNRVPVLAHELLVDHDPPVVLAEIVQRLVRVGVHPHLNQEYVLEEGPRAHERGDDCDECSHGIHCS